MTGLKQEFCYITRYFDEQLNKDFGELEIAGISEFRPNSYPFNKKGTVSTSEFNFAIEKIIYNNVDISVQYKTKTLVDDKLVKLLDTATSQHMEWLYEEEIAQYYGAAVSFDNAPLPVQAAHIWPLSNNNFRRA